jgi:hypothetical protein
MADEQGLLLAGMVISVVVREDVVVMDPHRLLAAARRAYRADNPDADEQDACRPWPTCTARWTRCESGTGRWRRSIPTWPAGRRRGGGCTAVAACYPVTVSRTGRTGCLRQVPSARSWPAHIARSRTRGVRCPTSEISSARSAPAPPHPPAHALPRPRSAPWPAHHRPQRDERTPARA